MTGPAWHTADAVITYNTLQSVGIGGLDISSGKFTAPVAGLYRINFNAFVSLGPDQQVTTDLWINGRTQETNKRMFAFSRNGGTGTDVTTGSRTTVS